MDNKYDVFISYSRHDTDVVNAFVDRLEREGFCVWIDRAGIESGDAFKKIILQAIKSSAVVLFFSSQHSNQSSWTAKEIGVAVKYKKPIIPILLDGSNFNEEVEFDLINLDFIDYQDVTVRGIMMDRLVKSLKTKITNPIGQKKAEEARLKAEALERERLEQERRKKEEAERKAREEAERQAREAAERERKALLATSVSPTLHGDTPNPPKKKTLWIALAAVAVATLVAILLFNALTKVVGEQPVNGGDFTITVNGVSFVMKPVEGGTFQMGSNDSEAYDDEKPVHSVTVSTFYMGETEVTQALWKAVMGSNNNPSYYEGDNLPVEGVSWNGSQEFIRKLNSLTGRSFRLPTEAEWEYAARGGNRSNGTKYAGGSRIGSVAWYYDNSRDKTHAVKGKSPNELGLYDMSGNVRERCSDWYGDYDSGSSDSCFVFRGGSYYSNARNCRVSSQYREPIDYTGPQRCGINGFRLVLPQ